MNALRYSLLFLAFLMLAAIQLACQESPEPASSEESSTLTRTSDGLWEQPIDQRIMRDHDFDGDVLSDAVHEAVVSPRRLGIYDGHLYVLDWNDTQIKRLSIESETHTHTIGAGRGQGPGEAQSITDVHVSDSGVWVPDPDAANISHFDHTGTFIDRYSVQGHPMRVTGSGGTIATLAYGAYPLFKLIRSETGDISEFGTHLSEIDPTGMTVGGHLAPRPAGGFIFVAQYAGRLFFYDNEGKMERAVATIDGHDFSERNTEDTGRGQRTMAPDVQIQTLGVSIHDDIMYLRVHDQSNDFWYIDRYDATGGRYLDSSRFRWKASDFQVSDDGTYVISDTSIVRFDYR